LAIIAYTIELIADFVDKPVCGPAGFADDYAWMINAYLDLFDATADYHYIERAIALQDIMDTKFSSGNRYLSSDPKDDPTILIQLAEMNDGAEPSPNSVALSNLYRLRNIVDLDAGQRYEDMAKGIWNWAKPTADDLPNALPLLVANKAVFDAGAVRLLKVVIMAEKQDAVVQKFLQILFSKYLPALSIIFISSKESHDYFCSVNQTIKSMPYTHGDHQPRLYVCSGFTCHPPITEPDALSAILNVLQEKGMHNDLSDTLATSRS
jgi:uncharacterized protein YyaL (SSP411 family)